MLENIFYLLVAFAILLFMITVHEFGHYIAGRALKFKINEFAVGMGPKIFSRKNKKTGEIFSLRAIPLGGFCAFKDESADADENDKEGSFNEQKPWKRLIVFVSGAAFNFISAVLIVIFALSIFGTFMPTVGPIIENSPASEAKAWADANDDYSHCLLSGDTILEMNGKKIHIQTDVRKHLEKSENGAHTTITVLRNGQKVYLTNVRKGLYTAPRYDEKGEPVLNEDGTQASQSSEGLGIYLAQPEKRVKFGFGEAIGRSVPFCLSTATVILQAFGQILTGVLGLKELGGPITTIDVTMQVARSGFANILYLITMISINLAVFNLLPIPPLDGSKMIFTTIEWIRGKPINRKVENYIHVVGMALLLGFVLLIELLKLF